MFKKIGEHWAYFSGLSGKKNKVLGFQTPFYAIIHKPIKILWKGVHNNKDSEKSKHNIYKKYFA